MSYGLRCWNAAGQLTLEVTDRLGRYHSTVNIGNIGPRSAINYTVPGYATDGTWFMFFRGADSAYMQITEYSGYLNVFNVNWYYARGAGVIIDIFRG